jgi:hypothetical protein
MKLKLDDDGHVVVSDDKPVYVHDDGKEVAFDAPGTVATISRLNGEAKGHREAKEAVETNFKKFEGIADPEAAKRALETVKNLDDGKLLQADKVDEIKRAAVKATEENLNGRITALQTEVKTLTDERNAITLRYNSEKVAGAFKSSRYIAEKFAIPSDLVESRFGGAFKIEDGRIVAYDASGNKIFSRSKPGDLAEFDEALETLVDQYPHRDQILKGSDQGGSGSRQTTGTPGSKVMSRKAFDALPSAERSAKMRDGWTVTD